METYGKLWRELWVPEKLCWTLRNVVNSGCVVNLPSPDKQIVCLLNSFQRRRIRALYRLQRMYRNRFCVLSDTSVDSRSLEDIIYLSTRV